jgi:hypothetical protein
MQSQVKSIHVIGVCLVVLFGFLLNNEVDARSFAREDLRAASEIKRQEQSALRKRAFGLRSTDDEGDRKYEQAVRAVLAYAQHELKQRKRDDSSSSLTVPTSNDNGSGSPFDDLSNFWTEVTSNDNGSGSPVDDLSNFWTEFTSNDNGSGSSGGGSGNGGSPVLTETGSRQLKQRQANKRHWRNK